MFYQILRYVEAKPSVVRSDKTRTANVLNCFKNDRSSKFGEVIFKKYIVYKSRKSNLKFM